MSSSLAVAEAVFSVTAYAVGCDVKADSLTRAGTRPVVEFTVAADPDVLPIGTIVEIEGVGRRMVHDTGGAVKGRTLDLYVATCAQAKAWGRRNRKVRVIHVGGTK